MAAEPKEYAKLRRKTRGGADVYIHAEALQKALAAVGITSTDLLVKVESVKGRGKIARVIIKIKENKT